MPEPFNASHHLLDRHVEAGAGDRLAVTGPGGRLTYAELADRVHRVAAGLHDLGVRPEERVVMVMADGPDLLAAILAAMRIGAVAVPVSTMLTGAELTELVRDSRTRVLLVGAPFVDAAAEAVAGAPELRRVVIAGGAEPAEPAEPAAPPRVEVSGFDALLAADPAGGTPYETWEDSPALWLYTSGTTGKPKGAVHRHANLRAVAETYGSQVLGIEPGDRCLSVPKLFFAYGIGNSVFFPFSVGASSVLEPARPTPDLVTARLLEHRPTLFFAVPTFYAALMNADVPAEAFASVRLAVSAGEPLPAELCRRFTDRFGVEVLDGIGSTEALHIFLSNRPGDVRPGSTGRPVPGYELRLLDESGAEVGVDEPGGLYVRGASLALGYWCRTDVTRRVFQGEWLRTGDTYVRSADGYYTCLGRSDDLIKVGGIWVSPTEVEARLVEHPAVAQAAVVGIPDEDGLDKPVAAVVPVPGERPDPEDLVAFCRKKLAAYTRPRRIVFYDSLPATATGKLQRFAVRASLAAHLAAERAEAERAEPDEPATVSG